MQMADNKEWSAELDEVLSEVEGQTSQNGSNDGAEEITSISPEKLASYIDHTVLKLDATEAEVDKLCDEAKRFKFAAVCVRLNFVSRAAQSLRGINVPIACVVGFHEGTQSTQFKLDESRDAIAAGAKELDVVLNRNALLAGDYSAVFQELQALRQLASADIELKLILETSMLDTKQIVEASALAGWAGWDYVKTSTGFCGHGATIEHVKLMKSVAGIMTKRTASKLPGSKEMKVKASGGIRTYDDAMSMINAGADRLGCSAGVKLVHEAQSRQAK